MDYPVPFYYEVRFRLSSYDEENNIKHQSRVEKFEDPNPILARELAFSEFAEFMSYPVETGRVTKDARGNLSIMQPTFLTKKLQKLKEDDYIKWHSDREKFHESISVYLVVLDRSICLTILEEDEDGLRTEFELHRVGSDGLDDIEEQDIIDNLELKEFELYTHFGLETKGLEREVYHFGCDYYDSGKDMEGGAKRKILPTPHIWISEEQAPQNVGEKPLTAYVNPTPPTNYKVDYSEVISRGEGKQVEFKPSLVYNFKSQAYAMGVLNIIAKTINGFMNSEGGTLFIGVGDSGDIQGIDYDLSLFEGDDMKKRDKLLLEMDKLIAKYFGVSRGHLIHAFIEEVGEKNVLIVEVEESSAPVVMNGWNGQSVVEQLFVRLNASTRELSSLSEAATYIHEKRWASFGD